MEVRLLGAVEVRAGGQPLATGSPQRRAVLAALAVDAGRVVSRQTLIDRVWGDGPPEQVDSAVYVHVSHLRRVLDAANGTGPPAGPHRQSGGYLLRIDPDAVDLHRFRRLVGQARAGGGPAPERVRLLREAIGLWQGPPLAGLPGRWVAGMREAWANERLAAVVAWADAELAVDNPEVVPGPLSELAGEYPYAEPVVAVLLRALATTGRVSEALARYRQHRQALVDELGTDPGPELRRVHQAILRGEYGRPDPAPARAVPATLPADVTAFTGRAAELARLDEWLRGGDGTAPTPVVISAVAGTAGVGKTALAIRAAHQARDRFPDGQLYVNLRGYDPDRPVPPGDALTGFLTALGVSGPDIPAHLSDRAARYRSEVAGRRLLVLLDNAASVAQVRPLLPGTGSCAVLVTSRDSLTGLVARDGAYRLDLDPLPPPDARALLRRLIGPRADDEAAATATLADQCARLPLALRVAAELILSRPGTTIAELVAELTDRQRRLRRLAVDGDPHAAVGTVFSWSLQQLDPLAAQGFRRLGRHPGPDFDGYDAAALLDVDLDRAGRVLDELRHAHLIHATGPGRYGQHDLLRAYAAGLAADTGSAAGPEAAADDRAAAGRLLAYYLSTATAALARLRPPAEAPRPDGPAAGTPAPDLPDADRARAWLDDHRPRLVAVAAQAAGDWPAEVVTLAAILAPYLAGGHYAEAVAVHGAALAATRRLGDPAAEATALANLASTHSILGEHATAQEHLRRALELYQTTGDLAGQARVVGLLGNIDGWLGRHGPARDRFREAITLDRRGGDPTGEVRHLNGLAIVEHRLGRTDVAVRHFQRARRLARGLADPALLAWTLNNLGDLQSQLGRWAPAVTLLEQALALFRELANRNGEAHTLGSLASAYLGLGRTGEATGHYLAALELCRDIGNRDGQAWALVGLGDAARAAGDPGDAPAHYTAALAAAGAVGGRHQQARAEAGLGRAHVALGDPARARGHFQQALALYEELVMPEAAEVRADLDAID